MRVVCWCIFALQQVFEQQISFMQSLSYGAVVKAFRGINCHEWYFPGLYVLTTYSPCFVLTYNRENYCLHFDFYFHYLCQTCITSAVSLWLYYSNYFITGVSDFMGESPSFTATEEKRSDSAGSGNWWCVMLLDVFNLIVGLCFSSYWWEAIKSYLWQQWHIMCVKMKWNFMLLVKFLKWVCQC